MAERGLVTFHVDGLLLGIDVMRVQEVLHASRNTPVPLAPPVLGGLINLRGEIVVAIDMRRQLGLPEAPPGAHRMNLVVRTSDGPVSLIVDDIGEVVQPEQEQVERLPETLRGPIREFATGIFKVPAGLLLALDVDRAVRLDGRA